MFTVVAMFIIDRFGRRILLMIGSVGMPSACCWRLPRFPAARRLGQQGAASRRPDRLVAFFAVSQGAVMFVFISEIFPNAVRAKGQSLGIFVHWTMAAPITWKLSVLAETGWPTGPSASLPP